MYEQYTSTPRGRRNERSAAMPYDTSHAEGYELGILADLASHQFDDLDKYNHEPAHASSSWSRSHPPTTPDPTHAFVPAADYWNPLGTLNTIVPTMSSRRHQTSHHHSSSTPPSFPTFDQPSASTSHAGAQYARSVTSSGSEQLTPDEAELRRQRNTAASARFRAKKKQREQSLEQGAREKREQLQELERRIRELEVENEWLRDLIMETTGSKKRKGKEKEVGDEDGEEEAKDGKRNGRGRKDGVGT